MARKAKLVRVSYETWMSLRALRSYAQERDEDLDDVIQKLLRFYLKKPEESKKVAKRLANQ